ncbi:MAG: RNA methyltransferase [Gammaproteobacteria bacterium]|nr:RNA methyltransferase [Gammaproteobacteria bacterium]MDE2345420.1 RNA methyltransferase [Gammaproteobacteria bacterium]
MPRQIRIVLVETSHPGNIGAAARAMKTMCLERLLLVNPVEFPHSEASARASGATDILERAQVLASLDEALAGCALVAGTSARQRALGPAPLTPRDCVRQLMSVSPAQDVAVVFGRERTGLTNEETDRCHFLLQIPANPDYGSLNLAAAVQVVAYEFMLAKQGMHTPAGQAPAYATSDEMEGLYAHLEQAARDSGFLDPENPKHLMRRLRNLLNRARPEPSEVNILRGLLNALQVRRGNPRRKA